MHHLCEELICPAMRHRKMFLAKCLILSYRAKIGRQEKGRELGTAEAFSDTLLCYFAMPEAGR